MRWLLLIYSVPSEPSRKRAFVWREIKRAGAVYLHDGVCVLPQTDAAEAAFEALTARISEFGGRATIVKDAVLEAAAELEVAAQMEAARAAEYAAIREDVETFLEHLRRETARRDLSAVEVEELTADLAKLQRWHGKVRGRDHLNAGLDMGIEDLQDRCRVALAQVIEPSGREAPLR